MTVLLGAVVLYGLITYAILKLPGENIDSSGAHDIYGGGSGSGSHHQ